MNRKIDLKTICINNYIEKIIMCITKDKVERVYQTRIASFHVKYALDNAKILTRGQLVIYSAKLKSLTKGNAFILYIQLFILLLYKYLLYLYNLIFKYLI